MEADCKEELRVLQLQLRDMYTKRDDLTEKLGKLKTQIKDQNDSRNFLHK